MLKSEYPYLEVWVYGKTIPWRCGRTWQFKEAISWWLQCRRNHGDAELVKITALDEYQILKFRRSFWNRTDNAT